MSGNGDTECPNKVEEVPTAKTTSEDEDHPSKNVTASTLSKDDGDQNSPETSINKADNEKILTMEEDVEAVIEKKLNLEKEKALDNDSEFDFELKWDDDNEVNTFNDNKPDTDTNSNEEETEPLVWETTDNPNNDLNNEKSMEIKKSLVTSSQANASNNDDVFKLDTNLKTDLTAKTTDSETNSLDERLVYSDVDVPDIQDKELLDDLDAHISKTGNVSEDIMAEENPVSPDIVQEKPDNIIREDLNSTEMDVDESKITDKVEEPQLNDTVSTIADMETSTYDVNVEHKLGNLDAMIEIPTQELIEDFDDDDGDMSDGEQYDEDLLLQNDAEVTEPEVTSNNPVQDIENRVTKKQENSDEDSAKDITTVKTISDLEEKLLADTPLEADDNAAVENILLQKDTEVTEPEVTTINALKDLEESTPKKQSKPEEESEFNIVETTSDLEDQLLADTALEDDDGAKLENTKIETELVAEKDSNIDETSKLDEYNIEKDIEMENNENHADITLEASHQVSDFKEAKPKENIGISDSVSKETLPGETKEPSTVEEMESSTTESKDIPEDNKNTSDIMDTEELSEQVDTKTKEVTTDLPNEADTKVITDDAQPSTSKSDLQLATKDDNIDTPLSKEVESSAINDDFMDAIPSTSKSNDLLPKDDELKANIIDTEQPSTSKTDTQLKETEPDIEKPSTSSMIQELSDADQDTDTLGLLAESSRVMDDDDEQENEQDDDDDDDDFDQDDESNQMVAEHSEDSNAPQSETDVPQETEESTTDKEFPDATEVDKEFPDVTEVDKEFSDPTETEKEFSDPPVASPDEATEAVVEESLEVNENEVEMAVNALITSNLEEESVDVQESDTEVKLSSDDSNSSSKLREILTKNRDKDEEKEKTEVTSPSKLKKLEISKPKNEYNIVDLEESSSEDDVQVVNKPSEDSNVMNVNIPSSVEVMAAGGQLSQLTQREGEVVLSVPKPPPHKPARLNTDEISIKTATVTEPMLIPEETVSLEGNKTSKVGMEIFNLDSDDDEKDKDCKKAQEEGKCINTYCTSDTTVCRLKADAAAAAYYGAKGAVCMSCAIAVQERTQADAAAVAYYGAKGAVCMACAIAVQERTQCLIEGIKDLSPLLTLDMGQMREEFVEISDSESEEEVEVSKKPEDAIGAITAKFLEENLEEMFNTTWLKYDMDERLQAAQQQIEVEVRQFEEDCKEIDSMLSECQVATDKLRRDLYDTFAHERKELPPIVIIDTPTNAWSGLEEKIELPPEKPEATRHSKRRLPPAAEPPAKKPAIPLGYTPLEDNKPKAQEVKVTATDIPIQNEDDNADIKVVKLSAEVAPAGLPGSGPARRPPLRPGMQVYAMRNAFGAWIRARIADVLIKQSNTSFTMCRVKFEHKVKNACKVLPARCLAYDQPSEVRMTIGTRVIALFADTQSNNKSYYSGIIAEIPNPVNNYRYLVFFDDGYAQYVQHQHTRLVCECAPLVWDEVHPFSRQFVRDYLRAYPERPMVRAHAGQSLKTEWNGKWWVSKVIQVDASLVQVHFEEDNRTEWIYRGSTRLAPLYLELQAAERQRARPLPRAAPGRRVNMPYVEYTRSDEPAPVPAPAPAPVQTEDIRKQRAVAKKSTAAPQPTPAAPIDGVSSRVVFYTPKNAIKPLKMVPHTCGPRCRRSDVLALKDLRTYNPLTKPLLSGWERQIVKYRFTKSVMYRAPCGRRIRDYAELHRYLQCVGTDMGVDLFDFGVNTHCLAEFVLNKCLVSKKDLSHGRENVPVPCVNYYDFSLPEFCSYNTERTPTAGVPLNLDPEFLCGCDCTDDCADKSKCACWKMTLEGARTIGLDTDDVGYVYKRLPEPLPSGIYECNVRCKCRQTCLNRVAQHPLQLKLQVFKTLNRGWGIRALNDVPKGAFLCVYAGNLLTDATANLDGLNEGDEYLAELDYIEVVEQMKEGFEEDIPEADKKLDKEEEESSSSSSSSEEEQDPRNDTEDADFRPELKNVMRSHSQSEYSKRLRKREKTKKKEKENKEKEKEGSGEDCITISDDEELREPSRFAAQAGMGGSEFVSKYKSVRAHFGKDEACYIMDAKVQGNIGRYLNHSCTPNVFVQNVFVDTHDPRFPWVAFFALAHIRAGTELTWNYNYDVGSVPGKTLYCHCGAPNCRGRLL